MKRLLFGLMLVLAVLMLTAPEKIQWQRPRVSKHLIIHAVQPGESFSHLSLEYYGTARYWQDLALVNHATDIEILQPGENIMIPARTTIEEIHAAQSKPWLNLVMAEEVNPGTTFHSQITAPVPTASAGTSHDSLFQVTNDSLPQLADFFKSGRPEVEKKLALPFIWAGLSGLLFGGLMLIYTVHKKPVFTASIRHQ
ncbi:hypothetical protein L0128_19440 [candidate division KSB1 bacterium]|nr:hypothetical protein [candidate division KSB1 bacterium]